MGLFDTPGEYDESSFWYLLRSREDRALDLAVKASHRLTTVQTQLAMAPAASSHAAEAKVVELERQVLALALYSRTILQVLVDKGVLSVDEFSSKLAELDLIDGKLDGR